MNNSGVLKATVAELLNSLQSGECTAVEVTQAYLDQIEAHDSRIGSFLQVRGDAALEQAASIDQQRKQGETLGALAGVPVAVKDLLCTQGETTTCASKILSNFRPPYDATVIAKLRAADAVLIGKTNLDEFAMGGSTENSAMQPTRNPWDPQRIPGGSSGGAAACVAASMAPLSVGTDTGGSIRQPAGLCGVTGMKPTYGRVSRYGLVAFASSLDQIGPLAHSAEDAARLLEVLAGHDKNDATSLDRPVPVYSESIAQPLEGLRIGIVPEQFDTGVASDITAAVREALKVYESLGATVTEIDLAHSKYSVATYYVIGSCEASSNLARYDGVHYGYRTASEEPTHDEGSSEEDNALVSMYRRSRAEGLGAEVKRRIMLGTYALSAGYYDAYYLKAMKVRRLIRQDFDKAFEKVDVIAGPVTSTTAFKIGEKVDDPLSMYLVDLFTVSANLAGICGLSLPCGFDSNELPIGLQLQAPPLEEERLLRAAHMFQTATDWHQRRPLL